MSPEIPVAPGSQELEQQDTQFMEGGFDEDVLAEIERRLDRETFAVPPKAGERVELDKADLPSFGQPAPSPPPRELEVDLAGEEPGPAPLVVDTFEEELPAEGPAKRPLLIWLAAGGGLLALLAGAGLWWFLRAPAPAPPPPQAAPQAAPPKAVVEKVPAVQALNVTLEPFLVPLLKTGPEGKLLRLGLNLEVADALGQGALQSRKLEVRDTIYRLLRDRPPEEVHNARAKQLLQVQIKTEINAMLGQNVVQQVFFTEFVITG